MPPNTQIEPNPASEKIPEIRWAQNNGELTFALLTQMESDENRHMFLGKTNKDDQNTKGDSRMKVCKRIAEAILPEYYKINPKIMGTRVKLKIDWLLTQYKGHAKRLRVTGEGVASEDAEGSQDASGAPETLQFYIGPDGPDETTPKFARNIWEQIEHEFPYFRCLHNLFGRRGNIIPIVVTTGVGPNGPRTVFHQPPDDLLTAVNADAANSLSGVPDGSEGQEQPQSGLAVSNPIPESTLTPLHTIPVSNNMLAPPQTQPSAGRAPKSSTQSCLAFQKSAAVQLVPQKRSISEQLLDMSRDNILALRVKQLSADYFKDCELLLEEYKSGALSAEQYQRQLKKAKREFQNSRAQLTKVSSPIQKCRRIDTDEETENMPSSNPLSDI